MTIVIFTFRYTKLKDFMVLFWNEDLQQFRKRLSLRALRRALKTRFCAWIKILRIERPSNYCFLESRRSGVNHVLEPDCAALASFDLKLSESVELVPAIVLTDIKCQFDIFSSDCIITVIKAISKSDTFRIVHWLFDLVFISKFWCKPNHILYED